MVLGSSCSRRFPCRFPRWNPPSTDSVENKFARDPGLVDGLYLGSISSTLSHNPTPSPNQVPVLIPALAPAPAPVSVPTNELFKKFIKAYLESNQGLKQPLAERKRAFKAKVPEVYYGKLHIDCNYFCQQYKDHFETAGATGTNWTLFAAFFLCGNISMRWAQYKRRHRGEELIPISWTEFKVFL